MLQPHCCYDCGNHNTPCVEATAMPPFGSGEQPHETKQFLQCNYTARRCKVRPHEDRVVAAAATPPPPPSCHRAAAAATAVLPRCHLAHRHRTRTRPPKSLTVPSFELTPSHVQVHVSLPERARGTLQRWVQHSSTGRFRGFGFLIYCLMSFSGLLQAPSLWQKRQGSASPKLRRVSVQCRRSCR